MAGEANTAEKQNEIRREQKRKQRLGKGRRQHIEQKESAKLTRFVRGDWSEETKTLLSSLIMEENQVITGRTLVKIMYESKLSIIVDDPENPLINGKKFNVTKEGFKDDKGNGPEYDFYSVTVPTGNGFGFQFKWDKTQRMFVC